MPLSGTYSNAANEADLKNALAISIQDVHDRVQAFVGSTAQTVVDYSDSQDTALLAKITSVENALNQRIADLNAEDVNAAIAAYQTFRAAVDADANNIIDAIGPLQTAIDNLIGRVETLETDNASHKTRLGNIETAAANQHTLLMSQQTRVGALETGNVTRDNRIQALEERPLPLTEGEVNTVAKDQALGAAQFVVNTLDAQQFTPVNLTFGFPVTGATPPGPTPGGAPAGG